MLLRERFTITTRLLGKKSDDLTTQISKGRKTFYSIIVKLQMKDLPKIM